MHSHLNIHHGLEEFPAWNHFNILGPKSWHSHGNFRDEMLDYDILEVNNIIAVA